MLSRLDVGPSTSVTELRLPLSEAYTWAFEVRTFSQVTDVQELEKGASDVHLRVTHRTSEFIPIFRALRLMRRFPFTIQGGEASWVVVATEPKMRELIRRLQERVPTARVESVRHAEGPSAAGPLTAKQADLLRRAIAAGYFEVPRKVTLRALAKRLGLAPSSVSEALAIVEKKLLVSWPNAGGSAAGFPSAGTPAPNALGNAGPE